MNFIFIHEEVKIVSGYLRDAVYDLPRKNFFHLAKSVSKVIKMANRKDWQHFKSICIKAKLDYNKVYKELCKNDIIFSFPSTFSNNLIPISTKWENPHWITNAIIDVSNNEYLKIIFLLLALNVKNFELRIFPEIDENKIPLILKMFNNSSAQSIDLVFENDKMKNKVASLTKRYKRIRNIFFLNNLHNEVKFSNSNFGNIIQLKASETNIKNVSVVHPEYFMVNIELYTESNNFNNYFNRKFYFSKDNRISNAPEISLSSWNTSKIKSKEQLLSVIKTKAFQRYWHVCKSQIDICSDCEFRYMCVDPRVPLKRKRRNWYFETECNYNPYIAKWKGEEGYKTLGECGIVSDKSGFRINKQKLKKINLHIWGND